jgi:hypothetical protein
VLSDTVFVLAELMLGSMAPTKAPASAIAAMALPVLYFILPNPSLAPCDALEMMFT